VFPVDRSEADPEIADHPVEETVCGLGSYLDVVWLGSGLPQPPFSAFESVARGVARALVPVLAPLTTAEIVVRAARLYHQETFGWTLYAVGFGPAAAAASGPLSQPCAMPSKPRRGRVAQLDRAPAF
jgi:hypothetical protein